MMAAGVDGRGLKLRRSRRRRTLSANYGSLRETMRAAVIEESGGPEALKLQERPIPKPEPGWVLIRVKAFGINRSELFTRQGHSPSVRFPRILGIEAVGQVAEAPGGEFPKGQTVATAMGGMGRQFDGSYAEYTCVPASQVQALETKLDYCNIAVQNDGTLHARASRKTQTTLRGGSDQPLPGHDTQLLRERRGARAFAVSGRVRRKAWRHPRGAHRSAGGHGG